LGKGAGENFQHNRIVTDVDMRLNIAAGIPLAKHQTGIIADTLVDAPTTRPGGFCDNSIVPTMGQNWLAIQVANADSGFFDPGFVCRPALGDAQI
jgi:hypothetical protein